MLLCTPITEDELKKRDWTGHSCQRKYDGVRLMISKVKDKVTLTFRGNTIEPWKFPELDSLSKINTDVVLDGELIVQDGITDSFNIMVSRLKTKDKFKIKLLAKKYPVTYIAFDILDWNGTDLRAHEFWQRMDLLRQFSYTSGIMIAETYSDPVSLMELAHANKWEGVVCKRNTSTYNDHGKHEFRTPDWIKCPIIENPIIRFTKYSENPKGITLESEDGIRCACLGHQSTAVKEQIDVYKYALVRCSRKGGVTDNGANRQITFVEMII